MHQLTVILGRIAHHPWMTLVLVLYVLIYGSLLVATDFLPYVMDNNESFSSLLHASNLYNYGVTHSYGLADESTNPVAGAHPYVHTHQGNFPRLFAFLIYLLGAQTIESQIVVTTFTVGVAAILLIFSFFARLATPAFAALVCFIFMSDYLLFAQWHVVTYRVWSSFLLFASLYCTHRAAASTDKRWLVTLAISFWCVFYSELVFAAFIGAACGMYAIYLSARRFKKLLLIVAAQCVGAALALAAVIFQAVGYLGMEDFRHDIYFTFLARNDFSSVSRLLEEAGKFYESRRVIFWHNVQDRQAFVGIIPFFKSFTAFDWRVHTPLLSITVWVLTVGWLLSLLPERVSFISRRVLSSIGLALLLFPISLVALFTLEKTVFGDNFYPVWNALHQLAGPSAVSPLVILAAFIVAYCIAVLGAGRMLGNEIRGQLRGVLVFLVCAVLAYLVVFVLSPGYIYSGYLSRHAPFTVFITDVVVAVAVYVLIKSALAMAEWATSRATNREHHSYLLSYSISSVAAVAALLSIFIACYWLTVQATYIRWLPPNHFAFLKKLAEPPFRGATFAANNYAAPVAASTGQWAYFDTAISQGFVIEERGRWRLSGNPKYLWFADRDTNPDYRKPQYFVCMIGQSPSYILQRLRHNLVGETGCTAQLLVQLARQGDIGGIRLVDYDRAGLEKTGMAWWAIVRFDWNDVPGGVVLDWNINPFQGDRRGRADE